MDNMRGGCDMNPESIFPNLKVYEEALLIPLQHQALWRADWHDYYSKCIYMVTLMKMPGIPPSAISRVALIKIESRLGASTPE